MEFETQNDLKEYSNLWTLYMEEPKKRNPLLLLYDVDSTTDEREHYRTELRRYVPHSGSKCHLKIQNRTQRQTNNPLFIQVIPNIKKHSNKEQEECIWNKSIYFSLQMKFPIGSEISERLRTRAKDTRPSIVPRRKTMERSQKSDYKSKKQICIRSSIRKIKYTTKWQKNGSSYKTYSKFVRKYRLWWLKKSHAFVPFKSIWEEI